MIRTFLTSVALIAVLLGAQPIAAQSAQGVKKTKAEKVLSDDDLAKRAETWVQSLNLNDPAKEARLTKVISTHLIAIRNWNNEHSFTSVPAGINPATGAPLSEMDRQIIAISAMPKSVHEDLMSGLRKDLTEEQVELILDKYTVGKVAFTMKGYHAIVPDLTPQEEATILAYLKQAREQAVDFKNMTHISAIFKIYKLKCQQYLNSNGRSWQKMYKAYFDKMKAEKGSETPTE